MTRDEIRIAVDRIMMKNHGYDYVKESFWDALYLWIQENFRPKAESVERKGVENVVCILDTKRMVNRESIIEKLRALLKKEEK